LSTPEAGIPRRFALALIAAAALSACGRSGTSVQSAVVQHPREAAQQIEGALK